MTEYGVFHFDEYKKDYRVLRQIASGAFGSVHCVQRIDSKVIHAAKYIKSSREDIFREVSALQALSESCFILQFVALYDNQKGIPSVLISEFLSGGDLCERVSDSNFQLTEGKIKVFLRQILRGISFIHSRGYLHLDLKPFNIVFSRLGNDYDLRIIDFGLAHHIGDNHKIQLSSYKGTLEYMSPEVMNISYASKGTDMWSFGVISYMLLSGGQSPFYSRSRFSIMAKVLKVNYSLQPLSQVSENARDFVRQLLVHDSKERRSADECLSSIWLSHDEGENGEEKEIYLGILRTLETSWMRRCLVRRRWHRLLNALSALHSLSSTLPEFNGFGSSSCPSSKVSTEDTFDNNKKSIPPSNFPLFDYYYYSKTFLKNNLIVSQGSFGSLYIVTSLDSETQRTFVSKELFTTIELNRKEALCLFELQNVRGVVKLEALFENPLSSALVVEYLAGGNLVEHISQSFYVLNEFKVRSILLQITQALIYIHDKGILHLDLNPFSVYFDKMAEEASVKISNFTFAQRMNENRRVPRTYSSFGLLEFMAPEVVRCTEGTEETDTWGLGIIAYMLASGGISPFGRQNRFETLSAILSCSFHYPPEEFSRISSPGLSFISELLKINSRLSAKKCSSHPWLSLDSERASLSTSVLETKWMKRLLAIRRWIRWFNALRALGRLRVMT